MKKIKKTFLMFIVLMCSMVGVSLATSSLDSIFITKEEIDLWGSEFKLALDDLGNASEDMIKNDLRYNLWWRSIPDDNDIASLSVIHLNEFEKKKQDTMDGRPEDDARITFALTGGHWIEGMQPNIYRNVNNNYVMPNNIEKEDYLFVGWWDNANYDGDEIQEISAGTRGNQTFFARWIVKPEYNIVYRPMDFACSVALPKEGNYYHTTSLPSSTQVSKTGYTFGGWYEDADFTKPLTYIPEKHIGVCYIYSKWTANTYSLSLNANGGTWASGYSVPTSRKYDQATTLPVASNIARTNYRLDGWCTDPACTSTVYKNVPIGTQNATYYAKWTKVAYSITYVLNGGSCSETLTTVGTKGSSYNLPGFNKMSKSNSKFRGWYLNNSGEGNPITSYSQNTNDDVTIYARFENFTNWSSVSLSDWMAKIPDDMYLNEINMPGAHDAGCYSLESETDIIDDLMGTGSAKTQSSYIYDMFNNGVRVFDIRLCGYSNDGGGRLCHGDQTNYPVSLMFSCKDNNGNMLTLNTVLSWGRNFLNSHPNETLVYIVTNEYGAKASAETIKNNANNIINNYKSAWGNYKGVWTGTNYWPQLSEVRGKIVFIDDFGGNILGYNIPSGWLKGGTYNGVNFTYENSYSLSSGDKWNKLQTVFNTLSGHVINTVKNQKSSCGGYIYTSTQRVNFDLDPWYAPWKWDIDFDNPSNLNSNINGLTLTQGRCYGWVLYNFVGATEARKIIATNP